MGEHPVLDTRGHSQRPSPRPAVDGGDGGPATLPATVPRGTLVVRLAMLGAVALLYVLRDPNAYTEAGFWAEDGTLFFKDAVERGWPSLLEPYAGQLIVAPRLIASVLAPLPVSTQPTLYAMATAAVAVLSCSLLLSSRWGAPVPLGIRLACLAALLCMPGPAEAYATLANVHWWTGVGLVLLGFLRDPSSRHGKAGESVFVALASASGFVALYGIPLLAVRAIRMRSRHSCLLLTIAIVGVALQIAFLRASPRVGGVGGITTEAGTAAAILARRVFGAIAIGDSHLPSHWPGELPDFLTGAVVMALIGSVAYLAVTARRLELGALLAILIGGWLLALWGMTTQRMDLGILFWPLAAARYFVVPKAAVYLSIVASWRPGQDWRAVAAVAAVISLIGIVADYRLEPRPPLEWAAFAECVDQTQRTCSTVIGPNWELVMQGRGERR